MLHTRGPYKCMYMYMYKVFYNSKDTWIIPTDVMYRDGVLC